ncbi:PhoH family protein [Acuticoccus sp. MNP-M23]|uniref:PhoH family protein n=1 Tax=Acuticoccus sp. MNP-M23 TaxID=3072793 RepID=UPI0028155298|nr:PhoH family protein [Acuticoccus sp. MNP-M23]WMS43381.1 PhoH family protein [Acuticoccus sp. MNP-M23]
MSLADATEEESRTLVFEDPRVAQEVFGTGDSHLAMIEGRCEVDMVARGNQVTVRGDSDGVDMAVAVLQHLYKRAKRGHPIESADVDGAVRICRTNDHQLSLPAIERPDSVGKIATRKRQVEARSPTQNAYIRAMETNELVFGLGPAGTGKTFLAVAYAAQCLERGLVERIILSRPAVEAGERLGFLPGTLEEKVDPYLRPLYDALHEMMPGDKVARAMQQGVIEVAPLAFMRGRTLSNCVAILDEAQNTTAMQMKMFLTRLGENSRMIVTGDPSQVDLPPNMPSGLDEATRILKNVEGIGHVRFRGEDVVRHQLVARIVAAYDAESSTEADRK